MAGTNSKVIQQKNKVREYSKLMSNNLSTADMKEDLIRNNQGDLPRAGRGATVYILQCANGQYYVGSTTNIARRLDEQGSAMLAINSTGSTQDELGSAQYRGARSTSRRVTLVPKVSRKPQTKQINN